MSTVRSKGSHAPQDTDTTYLNAPPLLVPIPGPNGHIIATRQDNARGRMASQASDVVGVRLKSRDFFVRVVVEDPEMEVITTGDEPVLAGNEANAADGDLSDLERLDQRAGIVVVNVNSAIVETGQDPGLGGMEVDALNAI